MPLIGRLLDGDGGDTAGEGTPGSGDDDGAGIAHWALRVTPQLESDIQRNCTESRTTGHCTGPGPAPPLAPPTGDGDTQQLYCEWGLLNKIKFGAVNENERQWVRVVTRDHSSAHPDSVMNVITPSCWPPQYSTRL